MTSSAATLSHKSLIVLGIFQPFSDNAVWIKQYKTILNKLILLFCNISHLWWSRLEIQFKDPERQEERVKRKVEMLGEREEKRKFSCLLLIITSQQDQKQASADFWLWNTSVGSDWCPTRRQKEIKDEGL